MKTAFKKFDQLKTSLLSIEVGMHRIFQQTHPYK